MDVDSAVPLVARMAGAWVGRWVVSTVDQKAALKAEHWVGPKVARKAVERVVQRAGPMAESKADRMVGRWETKAPRMAGPSAECWAEQWVVPRELWDASWDDPWAVRDKYTRTSLCRYACRSARLKRSKD